MKALDILKKNIIIKISVEPNYLSEAIKELEELNNRSCERCKKWIGNTPFKGFCYVTGSSVDIGGCNDYYEQKEMK